LDEGAGDAFDENSLRDLIERDAGTQPASFRSDPR
jgi:hypothetical protein